MATIAKQKKTERAREARERLAKLVSDGDTIYSVIRTVSRSGMSRRIDFYKIGPATKEYPADLLYLTVSMADIGIGHMSETDWRQSRGLRIDGCGMDMACHCVMSLSQALFGDAYKLHSRIV